MTIDLSNGTALSDPELLQEVRRLASQERHAIARLIAALGELDARRLYLGEGCSSLFTYCTQVLHLSEHAAYGTHRSCPCGAEVAGDPRAPRGRVGASDGDWPAAAASHGGESPASSRRRTSQEQARSRGDRREPAAAGARSSIGAQAANAESAGRGSSLRRRQIQRVLRPLRLNGPRFSQHSRNRSRVRKSSRSRPNSTRCSSPSRERLIRICARHRTCFGTASRTVMLPRSSTGP